jgi:PTH1 family peptidyl-tRNA hydrolase
MKLLVGLGNLGKDYARHRHNVGFMALERIAEHANAPAWRKKFHGLVSEANLGGEKCLLLMPTTSMNRSGAAVGEAARFYKIPGKDVIVFHDELDLAPGKVRVKTGGGVAGHNGLKSLAQYIGEDFRRVRIGIGHPGHKDRVHGHVLGNFAKSDAKWLEPLLDEIASTAHLLAQDNDANFMNQVSRRVRNDAKAKAKPAKKPARASTKGPSQRELARSSAAKQNSPAKEATPEPSGPLAHMLRRWFGSDKN